MSNDHENTRWLIERQERDEAASALKNRISALLGQALRGEDEQFVLHHANGSAIRWGAVEQEIHAAIEEDLKAHQEEIRKAFWMGFRQGQENLREAVGLSGAPHSAFDTARDRANLALGRLLRQMPDHLVLSRFREEWCCNPGGEPRRDFYDTSEEALRAAGVVTLP